jgi:hypothetical protein
MRIGYETAIDRQSRERERREYQRKVDEFIAWIKRSERLEKERADAE